MRPNKENGKPCACCVVSMQFSEGLTQDSTHSLQKRCKYTGVTNVVNNVIHKAGLTTDCAPR